MVPLPGNGDPRIALEDQPSSRSFFSRFALPIRSRNTRNIVEFYIRPAEPHRKYSAGDAVRGAVILAVVKAIDVTHLTVALRGSVRVYKNANAANEPVSNVDLASDGVSQFRFLGNGYASLFQDEQVLCADGSLPAGKYEFGFELVFPDHGLPSSIEFERGTIAYNITATLTRPNAMSPTATCERKVDLVQQVDVGPLLPPQPRTIYLEPISKKAKRKKPTASTVSERQQNNPGYENGPAETSSDLDSTRAVESSTDGSNGAEEASQDVQQNPRSPVHSDLRSEVSGDSAVSNGSRGAELSQVASLGTVPANGGRKAASGEKTIVATIELMKGGCLPGDTLPIRVNIQHTKPIRSMHGVIVTLYRQGRVDSAPPASLFKHLSKEEMRKLEKEEYYPKSKTGLGGLSLTSAGSCSVFRKDLSQSFSPLIVDPGTFTTSINTSVRVPENAFPSIKGVPGEMISFKYRLEVIVDLGGKLSNAIQIGQHTRVGAGGGLSASTRDLNAGVASFDGSLVNTDTVKREKGVIFDSFEVVVGTTDSSRRGKAVGPAPTTHTKYYDSGAYAENGQWAGGQEDENHGAEDVYHHEYPPYPPEPVTQYPYWTGGHREPPQPSAPHYIPPPELPDESALSEKERIRRAEQRLLPSQPHQQPPTPTAGPALPVDADGAGPSTLAASSLPPLHGDAAGPSAPTLDDLAADSLTPGATPMDDKQELERQRLLAEASAPPEFPRDYDAGVGSSTAAGPSAPLSAAVDDGDEPSAPTLTEEDEYGPQFTYNDAAGSSSRPPVPPTEPLPAYQR
ncbi:hypothetical protein M406DRAFT_250287 [Cryphonectria parasitica EP155]|uniref:Arrestin C-terminal-like domain-containing protein n=1 Tax=Cryphonectria parasitica (strain ATCC 38755 / EP155) TaxID=660469 RepID=A0A9P5CRW3_CRYP1|nr:uncharacterized protein M406DRAFT_250287 [Cryphonectria parasitica EP155]KAF3768994.1 hypothetical protein M406DRAFT_250287 [Cryphonectria parasitica EP155]